MCLEEIYMTSKNYPKSINVSLTVYEFIKASKLIEREALGAVLERLLNVDNTQDEKTREDENDEKSNRRNSN